MRLTLLAAGFVVGSVAVTTGVAVDSPTLVALGIVVAVLTGALLKPELGKQRYAARVERSRRSVRLIGGYLRDRVPMAVAGGVAGLVISRLTLGWWQELGGPVQCQDLFFPDPPVCGVLSFMRARVDLLLILVGVFSGWRSRRPPMRVRNSRAVFEVLGRLVAIAGLILGAAILIPIGFELPRLRRIPWLDIAAGITAGLALLVGGLLYLLGMHRRAKGPQTAQRLIGWLMFSSVLLLPLFTQTYLTGWWIQGALLSAIALLAVPAWGDSSFRENFHRHQIDYDRTRSTNMGG